MTTNKQYERVKEITCELENGIKDLFESNKYKQWLNIMSKFHDYSLNNIILISSQKPDATYVAGYHTWKNFFHRQVKKGEKGIRIIAPSPYKKKLNKIDLIEKDLNKEKLTEESEINIMRYRVVNVFDISQTEGDELPSLGASILKGSIKGYQNFLNILKGCCPVPIALDNVGNNAYGYYHPIENKIVIKKDMSEIQTIKTLVHEMAHQRLHSLAEGTNRLSRNVKEIEAESVAYTICKHFDIDTSDYSFAYIAKWSSGRNLPELKASLNKIRDASSNMIYEIENKLKTLYET